VDQSSCRFETPLPTHLPDCLYLFHAEDIGLYIAVKIAVKLQSRRKRWFLGPRFVEGGVSQISDTHFQISLTSENVAGFG